MYAITVDSTTNRIVSVTTIDYAVETDIIVEELPEGDITNYLYIDGAFVYSPKEKVITYTPSITTITIAQVAYIGMLNDTLLPIYDDLDWNDLVSTWYLNGIWTETEVQAAVEHNKITQEQATLIIDSATA